MSFCAPPRAKSWRQTLKCHSPVSPDPLNARLLDRVPKVTPSKNPRSANEVALFLYCKPESGEVHTLLGSLAVLSTWLCRAPFGALTISLYQSEYLFGPSADTVKSRHPTNFIRGYQHFGPWGKYPDGSSRYSRTSLYEVGSPVPSSCCV